MVIALAAVVGALVGLVIGIFESKRFIEKLAQENAALKGAAQKIADKL